MKKVQHAIAVEAGFLAVLFIWVFILTAIVSLVQFTNLGTFPCTVMLCSYEDFQQHETLSRAVATINFFLVGASAIVVLICRALFWSAYRLMKAVTRWLFIRVH